MRKLKKYHKRVLTLMLSLIMTLTFSMPVLAAETDTPVKEIDVEETQTQTYVNIACYISETYLDQYHQQHTISGTAYCTAVVQWDEGYTGWVSSATYYTPSISIDGSSVAVTDTGFGDATYHIFTFSGHTLKVMLSCDEWGNVTFTYVIW